MVYNGCVNKKYDAGYFCPLSQDSLIEECHEGCNNATDIGNIQS